MVGCIESLREITLDMSITLLYISYSYFLFSSLNQILCFYRPTLFSSPLPPLPFLFFLAHLLTHSLVLSPTLSFPPFPAPSFPPPLYHLFSLFLPSFLFPITKSTTSQKVTRFFLTQTTDETRPTDQSLLHSLQTPRNKSKHE